MAVLVFERLLLLLAPGSRSASRWIFTGLLLAIAPAFLRLAWSNTLEMAGLLLILTAMLFGLRGHERGRPADLLWTVFLAALALHVAQPLFVLLLPLLVSLFVQVWLREDWQRLVLGAALGIGSVYLLDYLQVGGWEGIGASSVGQWSVLNFGQTIFPNLNGTREHLLPNAVFVFFPLAHPLLCAMLPALFLLFMKTDLVLSSKKIVFGCILAYLLLLGGLPLQKIPMLLPAYALLLLLLFPAWDRFYCYGFLFFKRLTLGILLLTLLLQFFFCVQVLAFGWA